MQIGFFGLLFLALVILKAAGVIALSWWWVVLIPFGGAVAVWLLLFALISWLYPA